MDQREKDNLVRETIAFPVRYDRYQQTIWDSKGMMVCDIRGWGRIQYMNKGEERQDAIGEKIAYLLNEHEGSCDLPTKPRKAPAFPSSEKLVLFEWD